MEKGRQTNAWAALKAKRKLDPGIRAHDVPHILPDDKCLCSKFFELKVDRNTTHTIQCAAESRMTAAVTMRNSVSKICAPQREHMQRAACAKFSISHSSKSIIIHSKTDANIYIPHLRVLQNLVYQYILKCEKAESFLRSHFDRSLPSDIISLFQEDVSQLLRVDSKFKYSVRFNEMWLHGADTFCFIERGARAVKRNSRWLWEWKWW